jgi:hypothetical protein
MGHVSLRACVLDKARSFDHLPTESPLRVSLACDQYEHCTLGMRSARASTGCGFDLPDATAHHRAFPDGVVHAHNLTAHS